MNIIYILLSFVVAVLRENYFESMSEQLDLSEAVLKKLSSNVIGICNNKNCIDKVTKTGLEYRYVLNGDFDSLPSCGRTHINNRRLLCVFCNCDTVFQWSPTAIANHFQEQHRSLVEQLLEIESSEKETATIAYQDHEELLLLRKYKSEHDILEKAQSKATDEYMAEISSLSAKNINPEAANSNLLKHCGNLQKAISKALESIKVAESSSPDEVLIFLRELAKEIRKEGREYINKRLSTETSKLSSYKNDTFIESVASTSPTLHILVEFLESILGNDSESVVLEGKSDLMKQSRQSTAQITLEKQRLKRKKSTDLVMSLILSLVLSHLNAHYSHPLGVMVTLEVRNTSKSALCVNIVN